MAETFDHGLVVATQNDRFPDHSHPAPVKATAGKGKTEL
jgi:hypothetical protein